MSINSLRSKKKQQQNSSYTLDFLLRLDHETHLGSIENALSKKGAQSAAAAAEEEEEGARRRPLCCRLALIFVFFSFTMEKMEEFGEIERSLL